MDLLIKQPEVGMPIQEAVEFQFFLQLMANRRIQGHCRYGSPRHRQKYMSRLKREVAAYVKSGNQEQLLNIANYAFLEWLKPENKLAHFNPEAESVTRKEFGGDRNTNHYGSAEKDSATPVARIKARPSKANKPHPSR